MNECSKSGRCEHVTGWIENHMDLDRLLRTCGNLLAVLDESRECTWN